MVLQNAVVAVLVQDASNYVQFTNPGSSKKINKSHAIRLPSPFYTLWNQTTRWRSCGINQRFKIWIPQSIMPTPLQLSNDCVSWHRQTFMSYFVILEILDFLSATRAVKPAAWNLLYCELLVTIAANSQKWFMSDFQSARPLPVRLSQFLSAFWWRNKLYSLTPLL